jgi:hypothetical protein
MVFIVKDMNIDSYVLGRILSIIISCLSLQSKVKHESCFAKYLSHKTGNQVALEVTCKF